MGKTTVAAALGLVAARRGLRTIVAEVAAARRRLARAGRRRRRTRRSWRPGLHHISVDPEQAMEEYLVDQLPCGAGRPAHRQPRRSATSPPRRRGCASCSPSARSGSSRRTTRRTPGGAALRPRDPRRARHRPRGRGAQRAAHVRADRARGPGRPPGPYDRRDALRPGPDRRRRGGRGPRRCRSTRRCTLQDALRDELGLESTRRRPTACCPTASPPPRPAARRAPDGPGVRAGAPRPRARRARSARSCAPARRARAPVTTLPARAEDGRPAGRAWPRAGAGAVTGAQLREQAHHHLRRLGRRRQDDDVGGARAGPGGARASASRS